MGPGSFITAAKAVKQLPGLINPDICETKSLVCFTCSSNTLKIQGEFLQHSNINRLWQEASCNGVLHARLLLKRRVIQTRIPLCVFLSLGYALNEQEELLQLINLIRISRLAGGSNKYQVSSSETN